ncbi:MAG: sugar O-acetyltransferase [Clostridia bacterium]|nr:sugar O-acetyltransferase [Clostridia bacterium]MBR6008593.1 sugar O-acetyltransferase [Clostridia bacterium]
MSQEERIFQGVLFAPGAQELRALKLKAHCLDTDYNRTYEYETEKRADILSRLLGSFGEGSFIQGPIQFHYGVHTFIGKRFFGNFNLTVQDDAKVTIGDDCNFGPNVTIVTPIHPMLANERFRMKDENGAPAHACYAKPVTIGSHCWLGANVVVCPGVTIGDRCVIGAGSVVTRDIPSDSFAAGVPCRVIRPITKEDSMVNRPELLGGYSLMEE